MKAEDITSEQAWEDFKAGYSDFEEKHIGKDREGDKATLEDKLDIMNAKLTELNTDVSRLTDSVPQALGTIEEGKTVEEEAEQEEGLGEELGAENPEAEGGEAEGGDDDLFGGEDDGLDDYFAEDGEEGAESPEDEKADGDEDFAEDSDIEESDEEGGEASESDSVVSADGDDNGDMENVEESDGEDEDFIPIEDLDDSDKEPEKEDEQEEVLEKMVRILTKMDRRITRLERENEGLKKQLSQRMNVQTQTTNVAKSRPRPNTGLKLVKGSYNRPPVSTQYVANQRDIGVGISKGESAGENTSVFKQGLNEVFEKCNRIANQTN